MRASLRPSRVKRADFAFFATPNYRAKSVAFKPLSERNTGLWPVRPAGILTAETFSEVSAELNSAGRTDFGSLGSFRHTPLPCRRYLIESGNG